MLSLCVGIRHLSNRRKNNLFAHTDIIEESVCDFEIKPLQVYMVICILYFVFCLILTRFSGRDRTLQRVKLVKNIEQFHIGTLLHL